MIKGILKFLVWLLLIVILLGFATYLFVNESKPTGTEGEQAELLTDAMLDGINKEGYDSLSYIEFTFKGVHSYRWDKEANNVTVIWEENEVYLDLNVSPEEYTILEFKAYKFFINDSFWLVAPFKVRDPGVVRSYIEMVDGQGLLVTYTSGGVTPGDSYLWILDDKSVPIAWKLWTSNVPIGGLRFTWENWVEREGVLFSTYHKSMILDLPITDLVVR